MSKQSLNCCRSCLGETTTALGRPASRKPRRPEGPRRPGAREGGAGEEAQGGGREGEGEGAGKRTREGAGARARQGAGQRKGKEGTPEPLKQPPLQPDFRQEEEQIPGSPEIQKQRQGQREGTQAQQVRLAPIDARLFL